MAANNTNMYLLNNTTSEVIFITNYQIGSIVEINVAQAKNLATYQNPTQWDVIKLSVVTANTDFNSIASNLADGTKSISYNVVKSLYNYMLSLPEYAGYILQTM